MKQMKTGVFFLIASSFFIILLLYYWHRSYTPDFELLPTKAAQKTSVRRHKVIPMKHMNLDEVYKDNKEPEDNFLDEYKTVYSIDTPGCKIPFHMVNYRMQMEKQTHGEHTKMSKHKENDCGKRAVYMKNIDGTHAQATISPTAMKRYLRKSARFDCCFRIIQPRRGHENTEIKYSKCAKFKSGAKIPLETDFINVRCYEYVRNKTRPIYDDVYAVVKKKNVTSRDPQPACNERYNVLIVGMDSMSLPRVVQTMTRTTDFFLKNAWLCYRGYHKVDDNTFPNVMASLTGHSMPTISTECRDQMDRCNDMLMWSKFRDLGYVTAYGEDFLRLPDTFSKRYAFRKTPTDHYMRPLFIKGEKELNSKSLVCSGSVPAGQQILDYATDFVTTYRHDRFFGFFWMNSFSHNENSRPQDADKLIENFLNRLTYTGILENTFVILYSDHGIRFGPNRLNFASYYDERSPCLFIRPPTIFKNKRWGEFKALAENQYQLVTPYDLYNTLVNIHELSRCNNVTEVSVSRGCQNCHSLFVPVQPTRTCRDASIHDKWCSCHQLYPLDNNDVQGIKSVLIAVDYIRTYIKSINTKRCWQCQNVSLKNVIRIHFYYEGSKDNLFYVVAFTTTPGDMSYEAVVNKKQIVGSLSVISTFRGFQNCFNGTNQLVKARLYCICQKVTNCV